MTDATPAARTNSRWLADLPAEWDEVRLRHLGRLKTGTTPSRSHDKYYTENGGMPWTKPEDLGAVKPITKSTEHLTSEGQEKVTSVPEGSVLVCCIGSVGELGFAGTQLATNQQITSVTFQKDLVVPRFGFYALSAAREELRSRINTSVLAILSTTDMGGIRLPVPPLGIQQSIADFLDEKTAGIEGLIEARKTQLQELRERLQSLAYTMVTGGSGDFAQYGVSDDAYLGHWMGPIPSRWDVSRLRRLFNIYNGSTPDSDNPEYWDGGVPWLTPNDISDCRLGWIKAGKRSLTETGLASCGARLVRAGSIILSTRAPIGHVAVAEGSVATNQGCRALAPRTNVVGRFFYYVLRVATPALQVLGQGATFDELSSNDLGSFWVPVPPKRRQREIASHLDNEHSRVYRIIDDLNAQVDRLKEYRTSLITAAVTGQIDVRASTPAVV